MLERIGRGISNNKEGIQEAASETITNMVASLRDNAPMIIEGGLALLEALVGTITENLPLIVETGAEIIGELISGIATASLGVQAIIATAVLPHIRKIMDTVGQISGVVGGVVDFVTGKNGIGKVLDIGGKLKTGIEMLFGLIAAHPVIAVITAVIAAIVLLWTKCEWFRDGVKAVLEAIGGFFQTAYEVITGVFAGAVEFFDGIVDGIKNGISNTWRDFMGWLEGKVGSVVQGVKNMPGIHSPSTVFAGIGGNMAFGLAEGWNDEYQGIKRKIESGLNFGTATVGVNANYSGAARYGAQEAAGRPSFYGSGRNPPENGGTLAKSSEFHLK